MELNRINPNFLEHEGFTFLEVQGEYFKGCKRCGGAGHYSHNGEHDRCYVCDNTSAKLGEHLESLEAARKWCHGKAVRRAQAARKREQEQVLRVTKMEDHQKALLAADPEVYAFLMSLVIEEDTQDQYATYDEWAATQDGTDSAQLEKDSFLRAMAETLRWVGPSKPFTPKMISSVRGSMERRAAKATESAAHPAPAGRVAVTGEIASTRITFNDFGSAYKILVKDDAGFKVWCSLPAALAREAEDAYVAANGVPQDNDYTVWFTSTKGKRLTFTATLEPSQDDVAFAFGSRPTKGAWL